MRSVAAFSLSMSILRDVAVARDLVGRFLRDDAESALHERKRALDREIVRGTVFVGPHAAHRLGGEDVA